MSYSILACSQVRHLPPKAFTKIDTFAQGLANVWGPLDDVVMGGVSQSGFEVRQGVGEQGAPAGLFSGQVSSSNNGGFASVSLSVLVDSHPLSVHCNQNRFEESVPAFSLQLRSTCNGCSLFQ